MDEYKAPDVATPFAAAEVEVKPVDKAKPVKGKATGEKTVRITIHDSREIPPGGQMVGVNGRMYMLKPGQVYDVPLSVLEVLDNAIMGSPVIDPDTYQMVGIRNAPRIPYTVDRSQRE